MLKSNNRTRAARSVVLASESVRSLQVVLLHRRVHAREVVHYEQYLLVRAGSTVWLCRSQTPTFPLSFQGHLMRSSFSPSCLFNVCIWSFKLSSISFKSLGKSIVLSLDNTCSSVKSSIMHNARWSLSSSSVSSDRFRGFPFGPIVRSKSNTIETVALTDMEQSCEIGGQIWSGRYEFRHQISPCSMAWWWQP